jgi:hypothetical protein
VKEASLDVLMKISPKTRKSTTRSAKKTATSSRPLTRSSLTASKITPFEPKKEVKSPKKAGNLRRSVESQLRSAGTKRSFGKMKSGSVSSENTSNCSDISFD